MSTTKNIKVQLGQSRTFHRFALAGEADFAALQTHLEAVAKQVPHWANRLPATPPLLLTTYTDDEGDQVQLTNDADLRVALEFGEPLRLTIRPRGNGSGGAPVAGAGSQVFVHRRISPVRMQWRCGGGGGNWHRGGNGNWHRWAMDKYGAAPARRLAAAGGIDCKAAVAKLVAAMQGDAEALQWVDVTMSKAAPAPEPGTCGRGGNGNWHRGGGGRRCQPRLGQKIFSCRAGPAHQLAKSFGIELDEAWALIKRAHDGDGEAAAKIDGVVGALKARFGEQAAEALGVDQPAAAWAILEQAKHGDPAARQQLATAVKKTFNTAAAAAAAGCKPPAASEETATVAAAVGGAEPAPAMTSSAVRAAVAQQPAQGGVGGGDFELVDVAETALSQAVVAEEASAASPAPSPPATPFEFQAALVQLVGVMGFEEAAAKTALLAHGGDVHAAVTQLIG